MGEDSIPVSDPLAADLADLLHCLLGVLDEAIGISGYGLASAIDVICLILHHHSYGIGERDCRGPGLEEQVCGNRGLLVEVLEALRLDGQSIFLQRGSCGSGNSPCTSDLHAADLLCSLRNPIYWLHSGLFSPARVKSISCPEKNNNYNFASL